MANESLRSKRLAQLLTREVSELIYTQIDDERLKDASITDVEVSRDLTFAKIFVTFSDGEEQEKRQKVKLLNNAVAFFRKFLTPRLDLRVIPDLRFSYDSSAERIARLDDIFNSPDFKQSVAVSENTEESTIQTHEQ